MKRPDDRLCTRRPEPPQKKARTLARTRLDAYLELPGAPEIAARERFPSVTNCVAVFDLGCVVDQTWVALRLASVEFRPDRFVSVAIRAGGHTTGLLFRSGRMVVAGAKTYHEALLGAHRCRLFLEGVPQRVLLLDERGEPTRVAERVLDRYTRFCNFGVVNMVGSGLLSTKGDALDLKALATLRPDIVSWEPELFPGAKIKMRRSAECPTRAAKWTATLFDTMRSVVMGVGCVEDVYLVQAFLERTYGGLVDDSAPLDRPELRFRHRQARNLAAGDRDGVRLLPSGMNCNPASAVGRDGAIIDGAKRRSCTGGRTRIQDPGSAGKNASALDRWQEAVNDADDPAWARMAALMGTTL